MRNATTHVKATEVIIASCSILRDNREKKTKFPDAEVGGGTGGITAICSRSKVADDVIPGYNVYIFRDYHGRICE